MNTKKQKITIIQDNSGDWMGIYIDGVLVRENHSYDATDMLDILEIEYEEHWIDMEDSRLPDKLSKIKLPEKEPYVFDPEKCKDGKPHESIMGSEFCLGCGEPL